MVMGRGFQYVVILMVLLGLLSGCKKKKPTLPPPQAQAPNISSIPRPKQPEPLPPAQTQKPPVQVTKPKPKPAPKKKVAKKAPPKTEPQKPVVKEGTDSNGQLSAGLTPDESNSQRRNTAQLLSGADANLRSLTRTLNSDEQSMVQQIRSYMAQSRSAQRDGDTERAYNLALKAHLLSTELVKH